MEKSVVKTVDTQVFVFSRNVRGYHENVKRGIPSIKRKTINVVNCFGTLNRTINQMEVFFDNSFSEKKTWKPSFSFFLDN